MTQQRPRVRIEKKQYFDRNITDTSIEIIYFVLGILQVGHISIGICKIGISKLTYYISFQRMCLTGIDANYI